MSFFTIKVDHVSSKTTSTNRTNPWNWMQQLPSRRILQILSSSMIRIASGWLCLHTWGEVLHFWAEYLTKTHKLFIGKYRIFHYIVRFQKGRISSKSPPCVHQLQLRKPRRLTSVLPFLHLSVVLCAQLNSCGNELKSCALNAIPVQKSEPSWLP